MCYHTSTLKQIDTSNVKQLLISEEVGLELGIL
jgi:hypothetical protein